MGIGGKGKGSRRGNLREKTNRKRKWKKQLKETKTGLGPRERSASVKTKSFSSSHSSLREEKNADRLPEDKTKRSRKPSPRESESGRPKQLEEKHRGACGEHPAPPLAKNRSRKKKRADMLRQQNNFRISISMGGRVSVTVLSSKKRKPNLSPV